jgi:flagellar L-ring protein precursor FlgH
MRFFNLIFLVALVTGCSATVPIDNFATDPFIPVSPPVTKEVKNLTGSILADEPGSRYFGYKRRFQVGDVLTVILTESTSAQRRSGLEAVKEGTNSPLRGLQALIGKPINQASGGMSWIKNQAFDAYRATDFDDLSVETKGRGSANQASSLDGALAVMVTQVLPNDNLIIQGQKRLSLSEGSETVKVRGVVSIGDIQPDNTILSSRIAGAQIAYQGSGELADFAKVNWGTRFFNKVWPF